MTETPSIRLFGRPPRLDDRPVSKRIGLVILATDHTTEVDFQRMVAGPTIGIYVNRIPYANPVTAENLSAMQPALTSAAALILPDEPLDAIVYSCTSASVEIGDEAVEKAIQAAKPGVAVITPTAAAVRALRRLGARKISILTPYSKETSLPVQTYFTKKGFTVDQTSCMGMMDDREMARISTDEIVAFAKESMHPKSDALFISCTAVRAASVIAEIEAALGKPVVSSNLATAWLCLRLCGDEVARPELGRLMCVDLAGEK